MILLIKATLNTIRLTLTEKSDLILPNYLFYFKSEFSQREVSFILVDTSAYTTRYNEFSLTEGSSANKTFDEGFYLYEIYEQASAVNTNKNDPGCHLVEIGKMKVVYDTTVSGDDIYNGQDNTSVIYNG